MLMLMIDGDERDATRLRELIQRAGFSVEARDRQERAAPALTLVRPSKGFDTQVEINGVRMDPTAREASIGGQSVRLTSRELALLTYLCERRGSVLSRNHLLEHVWGDTYRGGPRTVDVHIRRLRSKLGDELPIDTVRSGGYRLRWARDGLAGAGASDSSRVDR